MARSSQRGSFRAAVLRNATQQRSKASSYGHLLLPRGVNVFKEDAGGRISLDILPYFVTDARHPDRDEEFNHGVEGTLWYKRPYKLHRSVGTNSPSLICPGSVGRKCPICEDRARRLAGGANWQDDEIRAMRPSDRNLYYVVIRGSSKYDDTPHIWDISQFCFQNQLNEMFEMNEEFGDFAKLDGGLTLEIRFAERKIGSNSFAETSRIDFRARDYKYDEKLVRDLASLDEVIDLKSYAEVERLFFETEGGADDGGSVDLDAPADIGRAALRRAAEPVPTARRSMLAEAKRAGTLPRDSEPEDDEEEAEDDEDQPEERSAYRRPSAEPARRPTIVAATSRGDKAPRRPAEPPRQSRRAADDQCPSGYRFGVDTDSKPECDECAVWNECYEAKEAAAAQ